VRRYSVQKCDRVGKAAGPEVGKANKMRIPARMRQIFVNATFPWVIVQASADQNATTVHAQFGCEARPLRVALARPAKINNCQNKKSSRKGEET